MADVYDLHLHSLYSDGDTSAIEVMREAHQRGLRGVSLTDHNGVWGITEAEAEARKLGLEFVAGIEVSSLYQQSDVHLLGYSQSFIVPTLEEGLAETRRGYEARITQMVQLCHKAGFNKVSLDEIRARRKHQKNPSFISYDVAHELQVQHRVSTEEARQHTVKGGDCYVPYGTWALHPVEAVRLLHEAGSVAILAHPGTILHEAGEAILDAVLQELFAAGLDGIEVFHPFHTETLVKRLRGIVRDRGVAFTGGSDWHGPGRFHDSHFGRSGLSTPQFAHFRTQLS